MCSSDLVVSLLEQLQHAGHLLVDGVDGLERADHHPELDDLPVGVAADDVDAVHVLALDRGLELEHGGVVGEDLLRVAEGSGPAGALAPCAALAATARRFAKKNLVG